MWLKEGVLEGLDFKQDEVRIREIVVYVQQDKMLQQATDAQFLVQCKSGSPRGLVSQVQIPFQKTKEVIVASSSIVQDTTEDIGNLIVTAPGPALWPGQVKPDPKTPEAKPPTEKPRSYAERERNTLIDFRARPATGWMEVMPTGTAEAENNVVSNKGTKADHLTVGESVQLEIKLRQADGNTDTMLSSCLAFTGAESGSAYDLTDYRGCAVDLDIVPDFSAQFNSKTGVKMLRSSFPMFKFPDFDQVHIKCSVLVCKTNCPLAKCAHGGAQDDDELFKNVKIIDKFDLETTVAVFDDYYPQADQERPEPSFPEVDRQRISANYHKSSQTVDQKIVKASTTPDQEDPDLLCLSPSRLIIAFGILLVVLLLALVTACVLWLRARAALRRPNPYNLRSQRARTLMPAAAAPPRPVFVRSPHPTPYIRVVQ